MAAIPIIQEHVSILQKFGDRMVKMFQDNIPKATGKTAEGIRSEATGISITIYGPSYIDQLEDGVPPLRAREDKTPTRFEDILEWARAKGINENLAAVITRSINRKGSRLWQDGGNSGALSNVIRDITQIQIPKLATELSQAVVINYTSDILDIPELRVVR